MITFKTLKTVLVVASLLVGSAYSANASESEAQAICVTAVQKILQNNAKASMELIKSLKEQGRITNNDLREYDRITAPARMIVSNLAGICQNENLDVEQATLLKRTLGL